MQMNKLLKVLEDRRVFFESSYYSKTNKNIPLYIHEGKTQLVIGFGCTGGKHRSVTFAERTYEYLTEKGLKTRLCHRDINKGKQKFVKENFLEKFPIRENNRRGYSLKPVETILGETESK